MQGMCGAGGYLWGWFIHPYWGWGIHGGYAVYVPQNRCVRDVRCPLSFFDFGFCAQEIDILFIEDTRFVVVQGQGGR